VSSPGAPSLDAAGAHHPEVVAGNLGATEATVGEVGKHALVYAFGLVISKAIAFAMLPVYTRVLTPADYGVMALVEMTLDVLSIIAGAQIALGIFRFYHKAESEQAREEVVTTALYGLAGSFAVVGVAALGAAGPLAELLFGDREHTGLLRIAAATMALQALTIVPLTYARVRDLSRLFVVATTIKLVLNLSLNILFLVVMDTGVVGVFISDLIASLVVGVGLTIWLFGSVGARFSRRAALDLFRYGLPLTGMSAATFIATFSDRYFLQASGSEAVVGLYNLAYQFGFLLVNVAFTPLESVWSPKRFDVVKGPPGERDRLLGDAFVYISVLVLAAALGLTLFVHDLLRIATPPAYWGAAQLVPVILIAYVFQCWANVQDIGILVRERTEYLAIANWLAALVALVGYALLIPRYLGWGAAVATVAAFFARWLLTYLISQRLWRVAYRWGPVIRVAAMATAIAIVSVSLPDMRPIVSVGAHAALFSGFLVLTWVAAGFSAEERARVVGLARRGWTSLRARPS
jgi:O-antigen/teichoic acid export membrane protein